MQLEQIYQEYLTYGLVDTDTRNIRENSIFFALKGDNFNGNKFAADALSKGSRFAIIDESEFHIEEKTILVENVLRTLQQLANHHRRQLSIPFIGLTGSNGKTTTKELIQRVLSTQYNVLATKGNLNNHIGVPLTILSIDKSIEIAVIEMGANHQKEIEFLCSIAEPDFGYITNFGKAHLEGFSGVEGVVKGKSELYQFIRKSSGICFVNSNDEKQVELTSDLKRVFLNRDVTLKKIEPFLKIEFQNKLINTNLVGSYNFNNALVAVTIGEYFKVSTENICAALEGYIPSDNRSQILQKKTNKIILDAYNANPSSVLEAIKSLHGLSDSKKIAILGDMFELGEYSNYEHEKVIETLDNFGIEYLVVGKNFYKTRAQNSFLTIEELKNYLSKNPIKNATILLKGSRGMALERLLDSL